MSEKPNIAVAIIDAISEVAASFAWPVILLIIVLYFRKEVGGLVARITNIKYPGGEINTQQEDPEAPEPTIEAAKQIRLFDPQGFRTKDGVQTLVSESGLIENSERAVDSLLLFRTSRQRTWLVTTTRQIFCVLDDEKTRAKASLIQWRLPLSSAQPVRAHISSRGNNIIDIGPKEKWLYSSSIHEVDTELEDKVMRLIENAQRDDG